jgi:hypothetical protein
MIQGLSLNYELGLIKASSGLNRTILRDMEIEMLAHYEGRSVHLNLQYSQSVLHIHFDLSRIY